MSSRYDVIIIGAGPSGIFCAYELINSKPELKILMIEKGRAIEHRSCPKRITGKCMGCTRPPKPSWSSQPCSPCSEPCSEPCSGWWAVAAQVQGVHL